MHKVGAMVGVAALALGATGCWMQPRLEPGRTNHSNQDAELTVATVADLELSWSTAVTDDPGTGFAAVAPVALNDRVYGVADVGDGGDFGFFAAAAFDAETGERTWTTVWEDITLAFPQRVDDPVLLGNRLIAPSYTYVPIDGNDVTPGSATVGFDVATGEVTYGDRRHSADAAVVDGALVATSLDGPPFPPSVPVEPTIAAIEGLAFRPVQAVTALPGDYAIVGDRVAWSDGGTAALGFSSQCPPRDGGCAPDWTTNLASSVGNPTALGADQVVYTDAAGTLSVLDMATGAVAWQAAVGGGTLTQATVSPSSILVGTQAGQLVVFPAEGCGAATCSPLWQGTVGGPARFVLSVGDVVFVATSQGTVAAFDASGCGAATCAPLATVDAGAAITGSPIVHQGKLIVGTADGRLVAFGLPD